MTTTAILRFWTLVMAAYVFLDEQRTDLSARQQTPLTIGQVRHAVQRTHYWHLIDWLHRQFLQGMKPIELYDSLVAYQESAKIV
jgi:hypothetical protein